MILLFRRWLVRKLLFTALRVTPLGPEEEVRQRIYDAIIADNERMKREYFEFHAGQSQADAPLPINTMNDNSPRRIH